MQTQPQDAIESRFRKTLHQALRALGYPPLDDEDEAGAEDLPAARSAKKRPTIVWDLKRPGEKRQVSLVAESMLDI